MDIVINWLFIVALVSVACTVVVVIGFVKLLSAQRTLIELDAQRAKREIRRLDVVDLVSRDCANLSGEVKDLRFAVGYLFHHVSGMTTNTPIQAFMIENQIHKWYPHKK